MAAIVLWVRAVLRRRWATTVAIGLMAGLSAGLVGAAFQAERRAAGSLERHELRSRSYDAVVFGCPPGVDPDALESFAEFAAACLNRQVAERLRAEVVQRIPLVERSSTVFTLVAGLVDPAAANGWGRGVLIYGQGSADAGSLVVDEIFVAGRPPDPDSADEIVVGELAATAGGIHVGDTLRLASWSPDQIDAAADGRLAPTTESFDNTVVGIVRTTGDVQRVGDGDVTGSFLPDALYAGPAWIHAHADDFTGYGVGVAVQLRGRGAALDDLSAALGAARGGWSVDVDTEDEVDLPALQRGIDAERQGVLVFAFIALVAGAAFVSLTLARQLRRELEDAAALAALGLGRSSLVVASVLRSLAGAIVGAIVADATILVLSPLGPLGTAGKLEYGHPLRADWVVLACAPLAVLVVFTGVSALAAGLTRSPRRTVRRAARTGVAGSVAGLGPVPRTALTFTRGSSPRVAVAVGGVAIAGAVAAGSLLASFDRVVSEPVRYGAWWDVVVGNYSQEDAVQEGVARVRANPAVVEAAGFLEDSATVTLNGVVVPFVAAVPEVGRPEFVVASGRPPVAADEVALGVATARALHVQAGDELVLERAPRMVASTAPDPAPPVRQTVRVTGLAVIANPINSVADAGEGVVVHPDLAVRLSPDSAPQSIVIRLDPAADRAAAIESLVRDFPGSTRLVTAPADIRNLARLRAVPWLLALTVALLAVMSFLHAVVTLLQRNAGALAVLAALGFTRGQRRRVGLAAGTALAAGSVVVGVPAGLIVGMWIWRSVASNMSIPSSPIVAWGVTVVVVAAGLALAVLVASGVSTWLTRRRPAEQLRVE